MQVFCCVFFFFFCETSLEFSSPSHIEFQTFPFGEFDKLLQQGSKGFTNTSNLVGTPHRQKRSLRCPDLNARCDSVGTDAGLCDSKDELELTQTTVSERGIAAVCLVIHRIKQKSRPLPSPLTGSHTTSASTLLNAHYVTFMLLSLQY